LHTIVTKPAELTLVPAPFSSGGIDALHDSMYTTAHVQVVGFGRYYPDTRGVWREQDWSLRFLNLSPRTRERSSIVRYLPEIEQKLRIKRLLAPSPIKFNGLACTPNDLNVIVRVGSTVIHRGADADACELEPGDASIHTVGGCAGGWLSLFDYKRRLITAHFGLKSIENGVIQNMAHAVGFDPKKHTDAHAGCAFPIDPMTYEHRWNHRTYGKANEMRCHELVEKYGARAIVEWDDKKKRRLGRIDLGFICREQFRLIGIKKENLHGTPSYDSFRGEDESPLWYTTRGPYRKRRNLMLFHHMADV